MRPVLVEFQEDGKVIVDESVYSMAEMVELSRLFGRFYVELIARLYTYRTPINPFAPTEERYKRALADTQAAHKTVKLNRGVLDHKVFIAARDRFIEERHDPLWNTFENLELKLEQFNEAIAATPVLEEVTSKTVKPKKRQAKNYVRNKLSRKPKIADPVEEDMDDELDVEESTSMIDNTERISKLVKTQKEINATYEEVRMNVLRTKASKSASIPMRASDMRKLMSNS